MINDATPDYGTIAPQMIKEAGPLPQAQLVTRHREDLPIDRA
jgi:hypothetical protein